MSKTPMAKVMRNPGRTAVLTLPAHHHRYSHPLGACPASPARASYLPYRPKCRYLRDLYCRSAMESRDPTTHLEKSDRSSATRPAYAQCRWHRLRHFNPTNSRIPAGVGARIHHDGPLAHTVESRTNRARNTSAQPANAVPVQQRHHTLLRRRIIPRARAARTCRWSCCTLLFYPCSGHTAMS